MTSVFTVTLGSSLPVEDVVLKTEISGISAENSYSKMESRAKRLQNILAQVKVQGNCLQKCTTEQFFIYQTYFTGTKEVKTEMITSNHTITKREV